MKEDAVYQNMAESLFPMFIKHLATTTVITAQTVVLPITAVAMF